MTGEGGASVWREEWGLRLPSGKTLPTWDGGWATREEAEREACMWQGQTTVLRRTRTITVTEWEADR